MELQNITESTAYIKGTYMQLFMCCRAQLNSVCQPFIWVDHLDDGFVAEIYSHSYMHMLEHQGHLRLIILIGNVSTY